MLIAVDQSTNEAVLGSNISGPINPQNTSEISEQGDYICLQCGEDLEYISDSTNLFEQFEHTERESDCINDGNVSTNHRLGQALVARELFNTLSPVQEQLQIDYERRIGTTDFVISDVALTQPTKIAVEIFNQTGKLDLHRRIHTMHSEGYAVLLVCLTNGRISPERIEYHFSKSSSITIGKVDPKTFKLKFGSVIYPDMLSSLNWDSLPNYLA